MVEYEQRKTKVGKVVVEAIGEMSEQPAVGWKGKAKMTTGIDEIRILEKGKCVGIVTADPNYQLRLTRRTG